MTMAMAMANTEVEAKLKFLDTSARLYSSTAPVTSAHLMLQHNLEAASNSRLLRKGGSVASCKGCGTILVPGWTSRTSIVSMGASEQPVSRTKTAKKRRRDTVMSLEKAVRTDCLVCHRYEEVPLPSSSAVKPAEKVVATIQDIPSVKASIDTAAPVSTESPRPATANASSKQRAKVRKKAGLQAILEKSKSSASPSSGFGLDLSDFWKQV